MSRKAVFLVVVCLNLAATAGAQEVLDSLIRVALKNNPRIQSARFEQAAAEYRAEAAGVLPDMQFMVAAMNLPRTSLSLDETPMSGVVFGVSQMVPWPSKLSAKGKIAGLMTDIEAQDVSVREDNIIRLMAESYYEYSYWSEAERILDRHLELTGSIILTAENKYSYGKGVVRDVLRAQTALAKMENRKLEITRMKKSALLLIGILLDNPALGEEDIAPSLPALIPIEGTDLGAPGGIDNPILKQADLMTRMAGENLSLTRAGYWPDLMVGIDYVSRRDHPMDAVRGEDYLSFKVALQMPVWFFKKQRNQNRSARQALAAAEADKRAMELEINRQIGDVRLSLETIRESLDNYRNVILPRARAAYEAAEVAYEVGKADFEGLLSAQKDLLDIELEERGLLKNYHQKIARFEELTGFGRRDGR